MSLEDRLGGVLHGRTVIVGIGNAGAGDDAAGTLLASRLPTNERIRVIVAEEVPESYLGSIASADPDAVLLIDAVDLGCEAGAVALLWPDELDARPPSTHRAPLGLLAGVIERRTGADVAVLAIQPASVGPGAQVSDEVREAIDALADILGRVLASTGPPSDYWRGAGEERRC